MWKLVNCLSPHFNSPWLSFWIRIQSYFVRPVLRCSLNRVHGADDSYTVLCKPLEVLPHQVALIATLLIMKKGITRPVTNNSTEENPNLGELDVFMCSHWRLLKCGTNKH